MWYIESTILVKQGRLSGGGRYFENIKPQKEKGVTINGNTTCQCN